jgi:hypothetical protein
MQRSRNGMGELMEARETLPPIHSINECCTIAEFPQ